MLHTALTLILRFKLTNKFVAIELICFFYFSQLVHFFIKYQTRAFTSLDGSHLLSCFFPQNANSGYSAPEVAMSGQYTMKSDVYSFGVVMLELLTGRKPLDRCGLLVSVYLQITFFVDFAFRL